MAKPDWGALQHQFLAEHAKSGISPKDWCEAQGLNYASAKRYIKIANGGANSQKKMRIKLRIRRKIKRKKKKNLHRLKRYKSPINLLLKNICYPLIITVYLTSKLGLRSSLLTVNQGLMRTGKRATREKGQPHIRMRPGCLEMPGFPVTFTT